MPRTRLTATLPTVPETQAPAATISDILAPDTSAYELLSTLAKQGYATVSNGTLYLMLAREVPGHYKKDGIVQADVPGELTTEELTALGVVWYPDATLTTIVPAHIFASLTTHQVTRVTDANDPESEKRKAVKKLLQTLSPEQIAEMAKELKGNG